MIIDDDPMILDLMKHYCEKSRFVNYCIACDNAIDGLRLLSNDEFDIVFLDYNMPHMSGKAFLELKQDSSKVVMITSEVNFAVESYNYSSIIDYLVKPIGFEKFERVFVKYNETYSYPRKSRDSFYVKDGSKWIPLKYKDIIYIKSDSNYVKIQTMQQSVMSLIKLKELEESLPGNFHRVHRSYIVNVDFLDYITVNKLSVADYLIPISNSYKSVVDRIIDSRPE